jgi:hypothetical protein
LTSRRPAAVREARFLDAVRQNDVVVEVLRRAAALDLPDWYLTGGCLFQTVWNVLDGRRPHQDILDYDLFYFDAGDRSWAAEDQAIRRAAQAFTGVSGKVEVRNEARVHLWYEQRFGRPCAPFHRTEDAIDAFVATACCVAIRLDDGRFRVYAPHGFDDLFAFVLRPITRLAPREVYEAKAARWQAAWPRLTVLPWPDGGRDSDGAGRDQDPPPDGSPHSTASRFDTGVRPARQAG